ncbi:MAG: putative baseplate assembly protein, partial [bacterium]|nr:putative baseplate assembly protein [bacterium]
TYKEIVDEAIRLIPHYCPEWTNHNPTDPGVALIELFAWMIEMVIYRLNKVPEKNYLTLLDLIGLSLSPPQPSKVLLSFTPVERYEGEVVVKKGIQVSTARSESSDAIVFETEKDLAVTNISLEACVSTEGGLVTDNVEMSEDSEVKEKGFVLFSGKDEIERYIYLSDPALAFLADNNILNITFNNANEIKSSTDEIVNYLEWEYWTGKKWTTIEYSRAVPGVKKRENEIYFSGPIDIDLAEVEGIEGYFLRASLVAIPDREICFELNDVTTKLFFHGEGLGPDSCICNTDNMVFTPIDMNKDFKPFLDIPKYNDSFYISSEEVLAKEDSQIFINFHLSDAESVGSPEPTEDLVLKLEYWNGRNWLELGSTTTKGIKDPTGRFEFTDSTNSLTQSGEMKFTRPKNMEEADVNGLAAYWVRVRISAGDFGTGGQYRTDENGNWEWVYDRPVNPPILNRIRLRYLAAKKPVKNLLSYYDFGYIDFSKKIIENYQFSLDEDDLDKIEFFHVFKINKEKCPITYLGFNKKFPDKMGLYFRINEKNRVQPHKKSEFPDRLGIDVSRSKRPISLKWEYWDGYKWNSLSVNDYTDDFHESGFIEFTCPEDLLDKKEFGKRLCWIRLILESGSFELIPRIMAIDLNSVYALNNRTYNNELMGSSAGTPSQEYSFLHVPLLPGAEILVRESEIPPAGERELILQEEGPDAIELKKGLDGKDEVWIRYHRVENFYGSGRHSRHYILDYIGNRIIFADGKKGIIPPRMKNNIKAKVYATGGGTVGNVGARTVNLLRENVPYVAAVENYYPAEGGADLEDLDSLKARATNIFKNLNRAVTAEDYEWLAREASFSVARSKCLSKPGVNGEVIVLVVPRPDSSDFDLKKEVYPTSELLRRVKEFLNARKLVGTQLKVEPPVYIAITINLKLVFKKEISEVQVLKDQVELSLRRYLHPITGGPQGEGWPFGMPLTRNEIAQVLEKIDGVHYIEEIEIMNNDTGVAVDKLVLDESSLIYVKRINTQERKNQF